MPPSVSGFWQPKILVAGWRGKTLSSTGTYTSPLWSNMALSPLSTDWLARLILSSRIQSPRSMAAKKGPETQLNWPGAPPSTGRSEPNRSLMSVWSLRLILTMVTPTLAAMAQPGRSCQYRG